MPRRHGTSAAGATELRGREPASLAPVVAVVPVDAPAAPPPIGRREALPGAGIGRLAGIDGLRAIAVLAVVLYHAGIAWLPGGFLGVEVFFVISGYLITALLLAEWSGSGRIDVRAFWMRRARRLLPALFFMLAVSLAFVVVWLPGEVARLRGDVLAALGYVTNWYLILGQQSYFETAARPSLYLHLWSLAVEEQFYLVWPLLLTGALLLLRRRGALVATLLLAAASAIWMAALFDPAADPSRVYYGTDTRAAGLLIGAALAFVWVPSGAATAAGRVRLRAFAADAVAVLGLAAVVLFFVFVDESQPLLYLGGFAALSLVTAAVIAAVVHPLGRVGPRILDLPPLRWVGTRSYAIYLWYWPVSLVTRPGLDVPIDGPANLALQLAIVFAMAELSYRLVETPIRHGALGRAIRSWRARDGWRPRLVGWPAPAALGLVLLVSSLAVEVAVASSPSEPSYLAVSAINGIVSGDAGSSPGVATASLDAGGPGTAAPAASPVPATAAASRGQPGGSDPAATPVPAGSSGPTAGAPAGSTPPTPRPSAHPSARPSSASRIPAFAVGDSVLLGAVHELAHDIGPLQVNAFVGRSIADGVDAINQRVDAGPMPDVVIVHLGDNGDFFPAQFDAAMHALRHVKTVLWVNLTVPRDYQNPNNAVIAAGVARYPNAHLVDWHDASAGQSGLFWDDGYHLRPEGAVVYAHLIAATLKQITQGASAATSP